MNRKQRGPNLTDAAIADIVARIAQREKPEDIATATGFGLTKVYEVRRWMRRLGVLPTVKAEKGPSPDTARTPSDSGLTPNSDFSRGAA